MSVLNNVQRSTSGSLDGRSDTTPLITAMYLDSGALEVTRYLLSQDAHVQITANDLVRSMKPAQRKGFTAEDLEHELRAKLQQPLEHAIARGNGCGNGPAAARARCRSQHPLQARHALAERSQITTSGRADAAGLGAVQDR